jgi:uncharacterized membrane protein YkoI
MSDSIAMVRGRRAVLVFALILTLALLAMTSLAVADEHARDDDAAPQAGEVVPLDDLLARIREDFHGSILKVELEQEWRRDGRIWVYEAKILTPQGDVLKLEYDAKSLELLERKGGRERDRHEDGED